MADARLSQLPIEVLQEEDDPPDLRLSQLPIEILVAPPPPAAVAQWRPTFPDRVPRTTLPIACQQYTFNPDPIPNGPGHITQVLFEAVVVDVPPTQARVTQVLWEIIILRGQPLPPSTVCPPGFPTDEGSTGGCSASVFP